jgi:hypothetical protein
MRLVIWHGRLDPKTGGTTLEGTQIEDWGFQGPVVENVVELGFTYGCFYLFFKNDEDLLAAQKLTGWQHSVHDFGLDMEFEGDCLSIYNEERKRREFFGDWELQIEHT